MRIVFDNIIFSLQKSGGISVVWQELLSRFMKTGKDELTFIEHKSDWDNSFRKSLDLSNYKVEKKRSMFLAIKRYFNPKVKMNEPFIFHSSYFRTCNNRNAINVTTVHDFTYDYFFKGKRRGAWVHLWQRNKAIRHSDAIVCISENTKRDLLKFLPDVNPEKIRVICNGISKEYKQINDSILEYNDYLLYVGGRISYKNARWFAEAIKDTDYKVLFCGSSMTIDEKKYYDATLGANRYKVIIHPSNTELNIIYNSVKCLVYPSSYEGFGIPVLEAQSAGCPVIALDTSSIPEIIGDTSLLMRNLTKEELLGKLSELDDSSFRQRVVAAGLENVKRFSWYDSFSQYRQLYKELMSSRTNYVLE